MSSCENGRTSHGGLNSMTMSIQSSDKPFGSWMTTDHYLLRVVMAHTALFPLEVFALISLTFEVYLNGLNMAGHFLNGVHKFIDVVKVQLHTFAHGISIMITPGVGNAGGNSNWMNGHSTGSEDSMLCGEINLHQLLNGMSDGSLLRSRSSLAWKAILVTLLSGNQVLRIEQPSFATHCAALLCLIVYNYKLFPYHSNRDDMIYYDSIMLCYNVGVLPASFAEEPVLC